MSKKIDFEGDDLNKFLDDTAKRPAFQEAYNQMSTTPRLDGGSGTLLDKVVEEGTDFILSNKKSFSNQSAALGHRTSEDYKSHYQSNSSSSSFKKPNPPSYQKSPFSRKK